MSGTLYITSQTCCAVRSWINLWIQKQILAQVRQMTPELTAEQFGLGFTLPDFLRELYKSFGSTLDRFHDESDYRLPLPARYVIDKRGIIRAADVNADYTIRPEPSETVEHLRTLTK